MDPHSHNLLEGYFNDGNNKFHYNSLKSGDNLFKVSFTRIVAPSGISITIDQIDPVSGGPAPTQGDVTFLTNEVELFQGRPLNGNECVTLGWTYLGNMRDNAANIAAAKVACEANGHKFVSLFYQNGYFVYGCIEDKLFYDQNS